MVNRPPAEFPPTTMSNRQSGHRVPPVARDFSLPDYPPDNQKSADRTSTWSHEPPNYRIVICFAI